MRGAWFACLLLATASVHADTADELFTKGRERLKAGDNEGACKAFEASLALDHAFGTLFNLGDCQVKLGKLASAMRTYKEIADGDPNAEGRARASELAAQLAARVPHLAISVAGAPPGLVATIDSVRFDPTTEIPLDIGPQLLVVRAPGYDEVRQPITVK